MSWEDEESDAIPEGYAYYYNERPPSVDEILEDLDRRLAERDDRNLTTDHDDEDMMTSSVEVEDLLRTMDRRLSERRLILWTDWERNLPEEEPLEEETRPTEGQTVERNEERRRRQPGRTGDEPPEEEEEDTDSDTEPSYPEAWPPKTPPDLSQLQVITINNLKGKKKDKYRKKYKDATTREGQVHIYLMKTKKRALVYVISNETFHFKEQFPDRPGTEKDEEGLKQLFTKLGCKDVIVDRNLTSAEMWRRLCNKAKTTKFQDYDCFILFVLSHGQKGVVFGVDGMIRRKSQMVNYLDVENITDLFTKADGLRGKPKLFFIQACQGSKKDVGVDITLPDEASRAALGATPAAGPSRPVSAQTLTAPDGEHPGSLDFLRREETDARVETRAAMSDIFIAMATTPKFVAWRRPDFGTWFVQAIIEVFSKYAYQKELLDMMRMVNGLMGKAEATKNNFKQVMEKRDTFYKKFYFFPNLYQSP